MLLVDIRYQNLLLVLYLVYKNIQKYINHSKTLIMITMSLVIVL